MTVTEHSEMLNWVQAESKNQYRLQKRVDRLFLGVKIQLTENKEGQAMIQGLTNEQIYRLMQDTSTK